MVTTADDCGVDLPKALLDEEEQLLCKLLLEKRRWKWSVGPLKKLEVGNRKGSQGHIKS